MTDAIPDEIMREAKPGSDAAVRKGCRCPILDNGHGRGYLGDGDKFGWVIDCNCPMHGEASNAK